MSSMNLFVVVLIVVAFSITPAFAQDKLKEAELTTTELIILFSVAIAMVIGIFLYAAREIIMRKKTSYDKGKFESQKDRDYEKYHSDWGDESIFDDKNKSKYDEEFREQLEDSGLPDYYKILGVPKDATQEEIKKQYRKLAKETHPDKAKTKASEDLMAEINKAYEVLSDEERRERYDKFLDVS